MLCDFHLLYFHSSPIVIPTNCTEKLKIIQESGCRSWKNWLKDLEMKWSSKLSPGSYLFQEVGSATLAFIPFAPLEASRGEKYPHITQKDMDVL